MARRARCCEPGTIQHVISRFLDCRFYNSDAADRVRYLDIVGGVLPRTDWRLLAFATMGGHTHLDPLIGRNTFRDVVVPINTRCAMHWHRRRGGLGPVLADRPTNHRVWPGRIAEFVAYNHVDPVRNGLVRHLFDSTWTNHRFYLRRVRAPAWLDVEVALDLCGFSDTAADRKRFDDFVRWCTRQHWQADDDADAAMETHVDLGGLVEGCSPFNWPKFVDACASVAGVPRAAVLGSLRVPGAKVGRRLAATAAYQPGVPGTAITKHLGIARCTLYRWIKETHASLLLRQVVERLK